MPESLVPTMDYTWIWILLLSIIFVICLIIFLAKRKPRKTIDPLARRKAAYKAAVKSFSEATATNSREAAVKSSMILRRFLADAVADPALFETHEEFITRQDSLTKLTQTAREAATVAFSKLAKIKYAPEIPSDDPSSILANGRQLLDTLNGGFVS